MATKKPEKSSKSYEVRFVSCELDKSTKEALIKWDPKFESTFEGLDRLITDGYKVSISHDSYHDCVGVFCTMPDTSNEHHGFCLTARAPSWMEAVKVLVYKHFNILSENWGSEVNQPRQKSQWG